MKKILFIIPSLEVGGLEKVQINIANVLVDKGYDVTVMTLNPQADLKSELNRNIHFIYKPYKSHPIMRRIPYIRHKFYDDGMWETRASAKKLYRYYVGNEKYDVEIGFFRGLSIKIISGSTNKNSVKLAWVHNDFRKATGYKNNFKNIKAVYNAYSAFDKVVCVSNEAQEGFKSVIGDTGNLRVIYNIISHKEVLAKAQEVPIIKINKGELHAVLVGRLLDKAKGQKRIMSVVAKLHNEGYNVSLALVGGGTDEEDLKQKLLELKAQNYIILTGNQENPYPYMKEADLYVCASYYEGFPLAVAEAMILGLPVLSTYCTGPNEMLNYGEYGLIVNNSEQGLYDGLKKILSDPNLITFYKEKTQERKAFFDEDSIINQITNLFKLDNY